MHKLADTPITLEMFETGDYIHDLGISIGADGDYGYYLNQVVNPFIEMLEDLRRNYNETKDIRYWKELIRWLPESWSQKRTITMNYETLRNIVKWRSNHKLVEWREFVTFIQRNAPYADDFIFYNITPE